MRNLPIANVAAIEEADLWFVDERLRVHGVAPDEASRRVAELKRYFLTGGASPLPMESAEVDEAWHAFLLFTREYEQFCRRAFSCFVHHEPAENRDGADCNTHPKCNARIAAMPPLERPFDAALLEARLRQRGSVAPELVGDTIRELMRFFELVREHGPKLGMHSDAVDEAWHELIYDTAMYEHFCNETFGYFLHHEPRTSRGAAAGLRWEEFAALYRARFGELSPLWLDGARRADGCGPSSTSCGPGGGG
jgi:hypothetical protein